MRTTAAVALGVVVCAGAARSAAAQAIEFLTSADTGSAAAFQISPADPGVSESFLSPTFLSLNVPQSRKYSAVFFTLNAQALFTRTSEQHRDATCNVFFKVSSPLIPPNVEVFNGANVWQEKVENVAGDYDFGFNRSRRNQVLLMRRDRRDAWTVRDTTTNQSLPDADVAALFGQLIDAGFSVEVYAQGSLRGVSFMELLPVELQVMRVHK